MVSRLRKRVAALAAALSDATVAPQTRLQGAGGTVAAASLSSALARLRLRTEAAIEAISDVEAFSRLVFRLDVTIDALSTVQARVGLAGAAGFPVPHVVAAVPGGSNRVSISHTSGVAFGNPITTVRIPRPQ